MTEDRELQALAEFSGNGPVLSVYLDTDLAHNPKDALKLMFRDCIKNMSAEPIASDVRAVEKYLDFEYDWQARGLAIFASGQDLWKTISLPIPVRTRAFLTEKPYIRILLDVLDRFPQYGVALIDRESMRLFSVAFGKIQSETKALGDELKRHKQGGWASARYQRHEDNLALHNLKQAVSVMQAFCERSGCARLVLAGSPEIVSQVKELATNEMRSRVVGEFIADMGASPNEILRLSSDVAARVDLKEEKILVSQAITAAAKGEAGVIGLADTLYALHQGRVHNLLVDEKYRAPGHVCANCGQVSAEHTAKCPLCGGREINKTPDAVNLAIHKAIETGAKVNIVRQNEELTRAGGIVALLRY